VDTIAEAHDLHGLLQSLFLLVDDRLDDHGAGIHPRQGHEERKRSGDGHDELGKIKFQLMYYDKTDFVIQSFD